MTLGWHIGDRKGTLFFYKEGGGGGFRCMMRLYAREGVGAVVRDRELPIELDEKEISRGDVAHQPQHHCTPHVLLGEEVGTRGLGGAAYPPPDVELPRGARREPEGVVGEVLRRLDRHQ